MLLLFKRFSTASQNKNFNALWRFEVNICSVVIHFKIGIVKHLKNNFEKGVTSFLFFVIFGSCLAYHVKRRK